jgi:hypothetical protein
MIGHARSFVLLSSSLVACGGSASIPEACTKLAACNAQGGSQAECEQALENDRADAEAAGCAGEFDDYVSCIEGATNVCDFDALVADCGQEAFAVAGCLEPEDNPQPG